MLNLNWIPKKYHHMLETDSYYGGREDGYWLYLKPEFYSPCTDSHTIHEYTQKDVLKCLRLVQELEIVKIENDSIGTTITYSDGQTWLVDSEEIDFLINSDNEQKIAYNVYQLPNGKIYAFKFDWVTNEFICKHDWSNQKDLTTVKKNCTDTWHYFYSFNVIK